MITLKKGYYGSNVQHYGAYVEKIEVIVSSSNGDTPKEGYEYTVGFYTEEGQVCIDQFTVENFSVESAQIKAQELYNFLLNA